MKQHPCYLCGANSTTTSICAACAEDLVFLEETPPPPDATLDDVRAWAKKHNVSVFSCGARELGPWGEDP